MITHPTEDLCPYCRKPKGWPAHRRDNAECKAFERAERPPYALRRRDTTPTPGWRLQ